jgi:hypothetical protein
MSIFYSALLFRIFTIGKINLFVPTFFVRLSLWSVLWMRLRYLRELLIIHLR